MSFDVRRFAFASAPSVSLILLACMTSGCVLGPDYVKPSLDVPESYRFGDPAQAVPPSAGPSEAWWKGFGDPELDNLVVEGLGANHDLHIATARVEEFAARVTAARAEAFPQVGYGSSATRQRLGAAGVSESYTALLSASWEIDLWGRIRRQTEAERANLLATEEARVGVGLTLVSAIVIGYVTLLDLDRRLEIAEATVEGRRRNVEIFQMRLDGGVVSDFELMQVTAEYEAAVAAVPELQRAIALQENALSVLVGRNPGPIKRGLALESLVAPSVPAGLPSDLVARRPDILQSEQQLVAANAIVGAARSLYFPRLALTASGGGISSELDDLFSGPARSWSFVGQLLGPIFSAGAIDSANRQAEARREQALYGYQKTIQNAFRDVEDTLVSLSSNKTLVSSYERRVSALERAVVLSRERYDNGYADYLDVLDAERNLFSAKLALTEARGDSLRTLADLYRALGGDWTEEGAPVASGAVPAAGDVEESAFFSPGRPCPGCASN